jgi:hypothetical protein
LCVHLFWDILYTVRHLGSHWTGGWESQACLDVEVKRKILHFREQNPGSAAHKYTNWADTKIMIMFELFLQYVYLMEYKKKYLATREEMSMCNKFTSR